MRGLFGKDNGPSREELERQAAEEIKAVGGVPAAWGGPSPSEDAAPPREETPRPWQRPAPPREETPRPWQRPAPSAPPDLAWRSSTTSTSGTSDQRGFGEGPTPGSSGVPPASDAPSATPDVAPGAASRWGDLGAAVTGSATSDSPFLPPPLTDNQQGHGSLTPQDEEEAITGLALSQLAERPGLARNPEDIVVRKVDPRSAEEMRNRAIQEFLERKKQRGQGK